MAQTVANLADVTKEVFTQDELEKQFLDEQELLRRLERTNRWTHGKKAVVPIHKGRSGGYTVAPAAGSAALNPADEQKVDRAEYTVPYHWFQTKIEAAALNEATGGEFSVGDAKVLEIEGAVADTRNQIMRQFLGDSTAIIAACDTGGASTTVELLASGYGYDALVRGWLYPGLPVDVGTTSDEDNLIGDSIITAVKVDSADPDITISNSISTVSGTDFVSIANARAGATSYESEGLRSIVGSTTSAVGGLDPDSAGEEFWKPASVSTSTVLSIDLLLDLQRAVHQFGGKPHTLSVMSLKQQANLYSQLQSQVRFQGDQKIGAGGATSVMWNNIELLGLPEVPDRELYFITEEDYAIVLGSEWSKPTWASDLSGQNHGMIWGQGTTAFNDALVYPVGLACKRRNRSAGNISLTA